MSKEILNKLYANVEESLSLFNPEDLEELQIYEKEAGKYYLKSFGRREEERLIWNDVDKKGAPEEIVKQLFIRRLIKNYNYPLKLIDTETKVKFGREEKRLDVIVYRDDNETPQLIAEIKAPDQPNDIQQLKSYLNAEGAPIGIAVNGKTITIVFRPYPKDFQTLSEIPNYGETVAQLLDRKSKKKIDDLEETTELKQVIQNMEELVLANSGFDSFDEIFKLIYAKLYDEMLGMEDPDRYLQFVTIPGEGKDKVDVNKTKENIDRLFANAKKHWKGIFSVSDEIRLSAEHLGVIVPEIENMKLFGANLQVIDEAFEYLIPAVAKGKKGQYFTPRIIIDMCVRMLNPKDNEYIIDTACGSGGFLIHAMQYVKDKYSMNEAQFKRYAGEYIHGIDFDEKSSKIARAMMLIAGDGRSNIKKENSLDSSDWDEETKRTYLERGLVREFDDYDKNKMNQEQLLEFNFDVLLANPPFAGEVREKQTLNKYELAERNGKTKSKMSRHVLFIERNLKFIRPGGRLAIVLPQGLFNNVTDKNIREYISDHARILAVIGLDVNAFKPHTGTKTSVIFLQKWGDENPRIKDYPIFFGTSRQPFKDNSGDYVYKESNGGIELNTDLLQLADAFRDWVNKNDLNF